METTKQIVEFVRHRLIEKYRFPFFFQGSSISKYNKIDNHCSIRTCWMDGLNSLVEMGESWRDNDWMYHALIVNGFVEWKDLRYD